MNATEWTSNKFKPLLVLTQVFPHFPRCIPPRAKKDPYTYTASDGGGSILQRFGSPPIYTDGSTSSTHSFGLTSSDNGIVGLHNLYYTLYPSGKETITLFVNTMDNEQMSQVVEFDLNLTPEPDTVYDDSVFETDYNQISLDYNEETWGGAR